jgi:hypothetical protein
VKVGRCRNRLRDDDARCVDCLPYPCQVDAACDLLDEEGCQTLLSKFARDAEVVYLG